MNSKKLLDLSLEHLKLWVSSDHFAVFYILLKEDFRTFLNRTKYANEYYLDDVDYVKDTNAVGCFKSRARWIVYETDERGWPKAEESFTDIIAAFRNAASRRNLAYFPSKKVLSILKTPREEKILLTEIKLIESALDTLVTIDQLLVLTDHPNSLKTDIEVLQSALSEDKRQLIEPSSMQGEELDNSYNRPYFFGASHQNASVARVRMYENGIGSITINGCDIDDYFDHETLKLIVRQPLSITDTINKVDINCTVEGSSIVSQAGAIRNAITRALVRLNPKYYTDLKAAGLLIRDPMRRRRRIERAAKKK